MHTAPPDQRAFIDRLTRADLGPGELHDQLLAATHAQDARRDWITANWPHVVELEQINTLIATQPALAHWPAPQPEPVQQVLDTLRLLAPTPERREERSLGEIDQKALANDPVGRLEHRLRDLNDIAARAASDAERDAVTAAIDTARIELRGARHEQRIEQVFARYVPDATDDARRERAITVAHDTLIDPPAWVIEHLRHLHDSGHLATTRLDDLVTRVVLAAGHLDQHGHLPPTWPNLSPPAVERVVPDIQISLPGP